MNIGQASSASGVTAKMTRYYGSIGLIPRSARRKSGYRDYGPSDVHRLAFIRRAGPRLLHRPDPRPPAAVERRPPQQSGG